MKNIAVFASGKGSNFQAIIGALKKGKVKANLALLVCDNPGALVIKRAHKAGVKVLLVQRKDYASKQEFERAIIHGLKKEKISLIVLAGFMRMLSAEFVRLYRGRIINIHPALLPAFKGSQGIKDAFDYGVKLAGVTVHFVDEEMDHGPIILQEAVEISPKDTLKTLEEKIHKIEHELYPLAIQLFVKGKLRIKGRKVQVPTQ